MKWMLTFCRTILAKSTAPFNVPFSAARPADIDDGNRDWVEDYLIGMSDTDAIWYYERRRWHV